MHISLPLIKSVLNRFNVSISFFLPSVLYFVIPHHITVDSIPFFCFSFCLSHSITPCRIQTPAFPISLPLVFQFFLSFSLHHFNTYFIPHPAIHVTPFSLSHLQFTSTNAFSLLFLPFLRPSLFNFLTSFFSATMANAHTHSEKISTKF